MTRNTAITLWREICGSDTVMTLPPSGGMIEEFARRIEESTREACCAAIDAIDDGEAPEYRACQEAIRARADQQKEG